MPQGIQYQGNNHTTIAAWLEPLGYTVEHIPADDHTPPRVVVTRDDHSFTAGTSHYLVDEDPVRAYDAGAMFAKYRIDWNHDLGQVQDYEPWRR